jgi:hypothetical protein
MYPRNALQAASNPKSHVLRQIEYFYHMGNPHHLKQIGICGRHRYSEVLSCVPDSSMRNCRHYLTIREKIGS